jgi:hypothetical protein
MHTRDRLRHLCTHASSSSAHTGARYIASPSQPQLTDTAASAALLRACNNSSGRDVHQRPHTVKHLVAVLPTKENGIPASTDYASTRRDPEKNPPIRHVCILRPLSGLPRGPLPCLWGSPVNFTDPARTRQKTPQQVCGCSLTPVQTSPCSNTPTLATHVQLRGTCKLAHARSRASELCNRATLCETLSAHCLPASQGSSSAAWSTRMHSTCTAALVHRLRTLCRSM